MAICVECGEMLTEEEIHYYETRCEGCEGEWMGQMHRWRNGEPNEFLDWLYGVPENESNNTIPLRSLPN